MGQHTLLRTLAKRSLLKFGKYSDMMVGNVILSESYYLVWVYYNCSMISFNEEILLELRITEDLRIKKPGFDSNKIYEWRDKNLSENERLILYAKKVSNTKRRLRSDSYFDGKHFNKYALRNKNHGH